MTSADTANEESGQHLLRDGGEGDSGRAGARCTEGPVRVTVEFVELRMGGGRKAFVSVDGFEAVFVSDAWPNSEGDKRFVRVMSSLIQGGSRRRWNMNELGSPAAPGTDGPVRVQRKRAKGWRMPPNTVSVTRPGTFGNPFTIKTAIESGYANASTAPAFVVECFRDWLGPSQSGRDWWQGPESDKRKAAILAGVARLHGKNLACFCPLDQPCHADVLLDLANSRAKAQAHPSPAEGGLNQTSGEEA